MRISCWLKLKVNGSVGDTTPADCTPGKARTRASASRQNSAPRSGV